MVEMPTRTSLWRDRRGVTAVEYALLLTAILLVVVGAYRMLGAHTKKQVECAANFDGNCASGDGNGRVSFGKNALASNAWTAPDPGTNPGTTDGHEGLPSDSFPPVSTPPPPTVTRPGEGPYYRNDTPIDTPKQEQEDNRPLNPSPGWEQFHVAVFGDLTKYGQALSGMDVATTWFASKGYGTAAKLLGHWQYGDGSAVRIDPKEMMDDLPSFQHAVQERIQKGMAHPGAFDSGWQSRNVANDKDADAKITGDQKVLDWYYALNGYQYRVQGGTETTVNGTAYREVKVQVFKRYNFGNPNGGEPRNDLGFGPAKIEQNTLAEVAHHGMAYDFNVWGETTMLVPVHGQGPVIYR